jgi:hypothetical protein
MGRSDRSPLPNTPSTNRIRAVANNRLGAVYSSLHAFWMSRDAALTAGTARRDAYSVILFDHEVSVVLANNFTKSPDELLSDVLRYPARAGTNFTAAIVSAQQTMEQHWNTERYI